MSSLSKSDFLGFHALIFGRSGPETWKRYFARCHVEVDLSFSGQVRLQMLFRRRMWRGEGYYVVVSCDGLCVMLFVSDFRLAIYDLVLLQ